MNPVTLREEERIDDLITQDLKIIQSEQVFSFSLDSVLLARFCSVPPKGCVLDLCTGNGVIPLLLSTRTKAEIVGVEIQERLVDMARRNVRLNGLEHRIRIIHGDLREVAKSLGYGTFDAVTVNPPYLPVGAGESNVNPHMAIARHEIYCTLEDVVKACSQLVRFGGKVSMVHRPSRLGEIISVLRQYRLEPKRIRFVHPSRDAESNMVLIECRQGGKAEVRLLPPLIVYGDDGEYCEELKEIYFGRSLQLKTGGRRV